MMAKGQGRLRTEIRDNRTHALLVSGIARGEFAHAGKGLHALLLPGPHLLLQDTRLQRRHFHAAVVQAAWHNAHVLPQGKAVRGQARACAQGKSDPVQPALHAGIDKQGRSQGDALHLLQDVPIRLLHELLQDLCYAARQIVVIRDDLGTGKKMSARADNGIRMRTTAINAQNYSMFVHCKTPAQERRKEKGWLCSAGRAACRAAILKTVRSSGKRPCFPDTARLRPGTIWGAGGQASRAARPKGPLLPALPFA